MSSSSVCGDLEDCSELLAPETHLHLRWDEATTLSDFCFYGPVY